MNKLCNHGAEANIATKLGGPHPRQNPADILLKNQGVQDVGSPFCFITSVRS